MRELLPAVALALCISDLIVCGEGCFCFVKLRTVVLFGRVEQGVVTILDGCLGLECVLSGGGGSGKEGNCVWRMA